MVPDEETEVYKYNKEILQYLFLKDIVAVC
jgi:hypothetical protein